MKYVHAIKGSTFAFIIFVAAVLIIPYGEPSGEAELVLTVSTFLFAILAGFFISRSNNRFNSMREFIAIEDALWLSFYRSAVFMGVKFKKKCKRNYW